MHGLQEAALQQQLGPQLHEARERLRLALQEQQEQQLQA
jgi:hypothetical protein